MSVSFKVAAAPRFEALWSAQEGRCALCGGAMLRNRFEADHATLWKKWRATVDHVLPRSRGGSDRDENLQLAHALCNRRKGNRI